MPWAGSVHILLYILMYLYRPNFFIHRSIVLVQVSFVFVCTHTHLSVYPAAEGLRSVSYFKNNTHKKKVSGSSHFQRDFECVMIFYLYFCTKSIKRGQPCSIVVHIYIGGSDVQRGHNLTSHRVYSIYPLAS